MQLNRRLPGLDALRLFAALYIVMFHLGYPFNWAPLTKFFSRGPSATELFFILSGFLLTHLYGARPLTSSEQWQFLRRRWARIYPPYLLAGMIALSTNLGRGLPLHAQMEDVPLYILMIQTWVVGASHVLNAPGWSASCLMFFYLIFPVVLRWLIPLGTRSLLLLASGLWLVPSIGVLWLAQLQTVDLPSTWAAYLHNSPLLRSSGFVIGMTTALVLSRLPLRLSPSAFWAVNVAAVVALAFLPLDHAAVNNGLFAPVILLLLAAYLQAPERVCQLCETRLFRRLVDASLSLFLLHIPLLRLCELWFGRLTQGWQVLVYLSVALGLAVLCNELLARYVTYPLSGLRTQPSAQQQETRRLPGAAEPQSRPVSLASGGGSPAPSGSRVAVDVYPLSQ